LRKDPSFCSFYNFLVLFQVRCICLQFRLLRLCSRQVLLPGKKSLRGAFLYKSFSAGFVKNFNSFLFFLPVKQTLFMVYFFYERKN